MKNNFLLFDFDGVIADSFDLSFEIQKKFWPQLTENECRKRFEGNINDVFNDLKAPNNSRTEEDRLSIDLFAEYCPRMINEAQVVPGMKEAIVELEKNYTLIVISSTITSPIKEFLAKHDLAKYFAWIMGNDVHKSKVEKIKMVFEKYGIGASDCVFITDTLGDMREAARMGVGSIAVAWGFHHLETLLEGSPFRVIPKPNELIAAVSDYFKVVKQ